MDQAAKEALAAEIVAGIWPGIQKRLEAMEGKQGTLKEEIEGELQRQIAATLQGERKPRSHISPAPTFSGTKGESVTIWVKEMELFFNDAGIMDDDTRIVKATRALQGSAKAWIFGLQEEPRSWSSFKEGITKQFGWILTPQLARDELRSLRAGKDLEAFLIEFQRLMTACPDMAMADRIDRLEQCLPRKLAMEVRRSRPQTLQDAIASARSAHGMTTQGGLTETHAEPMELDAFTKKFPPDSCFKCGKFGHFKRNCPLNKRKEETNYLCFSFHVPSGSLLRLTLHFGQGQELTGLVDSGASHCFISEKACKALNAERRSSTLPPLMLADGSLKRCREITRLRFQAEGHEFEATFVIAPIQHDIILGKPWLAKYNPLIDWMTNSLSFGRKTEKASDILPETSGGGTGKDNLTLNTIETSAKPEEFETLLLFVMEKHEKETDPRVQELLEEFADVFPSELPTGVPPDRGFEHTIELLPGSRIPSRPTYRMSPAELDELKRQIEDLLSKGHIRPSKSPFGAPVLFVKKKDGSQRLCVDYRALNEITVKNAFQLPRVDEMLDRLKDAKVMSKIDLKSGFHQVKIADQDVHKTAFQCRYGHYEYLVMPFGLCNAPATFQGLMNKVMEPLIDKCVSPYMDDLLVYSPNIDQHVKDLRQVLELLRKNKLYANPSKCVFAKDSVEYLGHVVTDKGISVDPAKIRKIQEWPIPQSTSQVRSFLGLAGFYQKFVEGFSRIAAPLYDVTGSQAKFEWGEPQQKAFDELKRALTSAPVLRSPDPDLPYLLHTDASDAAIGAVLSQDDGDGPRPIAFFSRKISPAEVNYAIHEKELLAIVQALSTWRHYVLGCRYPVKIFTDHHSLKYFRTQPSLSKRQARWQGLLADYNYEIIYQPGKLNVVADALSRMPTQEANAVSEFSVPELKQMIRESYLEDKEASAIKSRIENLGEDHKGNFELVEDLLYLTEGETKRLWVPNNDRLRTSILQEFHETTFSGHLGASKTYDRLYQHYYWPGMWKDVQNFTESCTTCQRTKASQKSTAGTLQPLEIPSCNWEAVSLDFIVQLPMTKNGHDAIVVFLDKLSRMAHFVPTRTDATAKETARLFFDNVFRLHGLPKKIISDRDPKFTSVFWRSLFSILGTRLAMSTSFHPQTDGATERVNRTLEQMLRGFVNDVQDDWDLLLTPLEFAYNNSTQTATGYTPFFMNSGRHPFLPASLSSSPECPAPAVEEILGKLSRNLKVAKDNIVRAQEKQKHFADKNRREESYEVGEEVLVANKNMNFPGIAQKESRKLTETYSGPFKIIERISRNAYRLELPRHFRCHDVFNISQLKRFKPQPEKFSSRVEPPPPPVLIDDQEEYEVEKILNKRERKLRRNKTRVEYLVKWKGYSIDDQTWEPAENLKNAPEVIKEYETNLRKEGKV